MSEVAAGDRLPEFEYRDMAGEAHKLGEAYAAQPALILWLRHFG